MSHSYLESVPYYAPDALFQLTADYKVDEFKKKVNLGQGAYRDSDGNPWVLPSVRMAKYKLLDSGHEYLPIAGLKDLRESATKLLFGEDSIRIKNNEIASIQAISGTGSIHVGAIYLAKYYGLKHKVYLSGPTWPNHAGVFEAAGFETGEYKYYDSVNKKIDFDNVVNDFKNMEDRSIVVLHLCSHNPTGFDFSNDQWSVLSKIIIEKSLYPFFDCAYLGFNSGDLNKDSYAIKLFFNDLKIPSGITTMSFSKNLGLYGERVGVIQVVLPNDKYTKNVQSVLERIQRVEVSNPPAYGANIVNLVLNDKELNKQWQNDIKTMANRILSMRELLYGKLSKELKTPGNWEHIVRQSGMFSYLGLNGEQVSELKEKYHIYMAPSSRISVSGLNEGNIDYFAECLDKVVRK